MPHRRLRYIEKNIDQLLRLSPIVGLLGHRQVGKTTLLEKIAKEYISFDDQPSFDEIQASPSQFLQKKHKNLVALDEVQLLPELFPALKEHVRKHKAPGQFILSGSVRFTSRSAIKESLTGRIMNLEILPMTMSEIKQLDRPTILLQVMSSNLRSLEPRIKEELSYRKTVADQVDLYLERGGLPGVCFIRNEKHRMSKVKEQLLTILDRDLRSVISIILPYSQIFHFVQELAKSEGEQINHSSLQKITGISPLAQKKLLFALEAVFILRTIPVYGDRKGSVIFFEDQLEQSFLSGGEVDERRAFEGLCYRNARAQFFYEELFDHTFGHFLTRGGSKVPFSVHSKSGVLGIIPILEEMPTRSHVASAVSFFKRYQNSKVVYLTKEKSYQIIDDRQVVLPVHLI